MKALKENPVAVQSKQMLLNALLELMEKKVSRFAQNVTELRAKRN